MVNTDRKGRFIFFFLKVCIYYSEHEGKNKFVFFFFIYSKVVREFLSFVKFFFKKRGKKKIKMMLTIGPQKNVFKNSFPSASPPITVADFEAVPTTIFPILRNEGGKNGLDTKGGKKEMVKGGEGGAVQKGGERRGTGGNGRRGEEKKPSGND